MSISIVSIGVEIPGKRAQYESFDVKQSLLDHDITIIEPNITAFYDGIRFDYKGKRCLSDDNSFRLKEQLEHWRREIAEAVRVGKTVVVLLNHQQEVYVATGEESFSGTGRNQQRSRMVSICSNYEILPCQLEITNSRGKAMRLSGGNNLLTTYWAEMKHDSEYRVTLDGQINALVNTQTGQKIVGGFTRMQDAPGVLLFLPYVDFSDEDYVRYNDDGEECWTTEALEIGRKLLDAIVQIHKSLASSLEITPPPGWVGNVRFTLPGEQTINGKLLRLEKRIVRLGEQKRQLKKELGASVAMKALLFEKGGRLEEAILVALRLLGFQAAQYRDGSSEFDAVFESREGRFLGEAEGKDHKAIGIDKLRQLTMNIDEDFDRDEVTEPAKGVLIGNAFRLTDPAKRSDFFTSKCLTSAKLKKAALIKSTDLFTIVQYLSKRKDRTYAKACRKAILERVGIVTFPDAPTTSQDSTTLVSEE
jgi:hypothetical protein